MKIGQTLDRSARRGQGWPGGRDGPRQSEAAAALMLRGTAHAQRPARLRRTGRAGDRRRDDGFVLFLMLILIVVGSVAVFLNGLNTASASMKLRRDDVTTVALKQAKEGLIAWAATRAADGPGHLPCPDRKEINQALAGYQESTCVGAPARIGRLPFRTLGLPDLRDASGERLWYALSAGFRDGAGVPVNSDTLGHADGRRRQHRQRRRRDHLRAGRDRRHSESRSGRLGRSHEVPRIRRTRTWRTLSSRRPVAKRASARCRSAVAPPSRASTTTSSS